ncbi:MAG TPA: hypothetical protein PKH80_06905 [Methanofastidiosum sp.]|nr:hypothetical protein [Methanofastidiosum sp.]HNU61502.1 hypothetical protein [Methanofastidiosum sp.]
MIKLLLIYLDFPEYSKTNNIQEIGNTTIAKYEILSQNNLFSREVLPRFNKSANAQINAAKIQIDK